jgi:hypothetical protein
MCVQMRGICVLQRASAGHMRAGAKKCEWVRAACVQVRDRCGTIIWRCGVGACGCKTSEIKYQISRLLGVFQSLSLVAEGLDGDCNNYDYAHPGPRLQLQTRAQAQTIGQGRIVLLVSYSKLPFLR